MAFPTPEQLHTHVDPIVARHNAVVEVIKAHRAGPKSTITIAVDGDLDLLELLNKEIGDAFDAAEERGELQFGPGYTLEVTTPGVDLPLTEPRHWVKNRGRLIKLPVQGAPKVRVAALNDDNTMANVILREGKKLDVFSIELAAMAGAVVEIEFNQPSADEQALIKAEYVETSPLLGREENK